MGNTCSHNSKIFCYNDADSVQKCHVALPLTHYEITLLKQSWNNVKIKWKDIVIVAYNRSFCQHPDLRPIFINSNDEKEITDISESLSIQRHSKRFEYFIEDIIENIDNQQNIANNLTELGRRHCGFGAERRFVTAIGTNLRYAICESIQTENCENDEICKTRNAWDSLLQFLAGMLKNGIREVEQNKVHSNCVNETLIENSCGDSELL